MFCWEMYFLVVNKEKKRKKEKEEPILKIHVIMDIMWRGKLGIERRGVDDYTAMLDKRVGQNIKALGSLHYCQYHSGHVPSAATFWQGTFPVVRHTCAPLITTIVNANIHKHMLHLFLQTHAYLLADAVLFSFSAPCRLPI